MIESIMYFSIGFFAAGLSVLIVVPLVHSRAVRLTTRRLENTIPSSMGEILAEKDLLRAEFAMSSRRLEIEVEQLKAKGANQLAELGRKADAVNRLNIELSALHDQLRASEANAAMKATVASKAEPALTETQSELTRLASILNERSALVDSQNAEIVALTMQVQTLKQQLAQTGAETKAAKHRRDTDRVIVKAATHKLMKERLKFDDFHRRVAELVRQVAAQAAEDKILGRRIQENLESRLIEQARALDASECELKYLRSQIESAHKAEYDLRVAMIESEGRANAVTEGLTAETTRLQAALGRANGERVRLAYELANVRRQARDIQAA